MIWAVAVPTFAQEKKDGKTLNQSEQIAKEYVDAFLQTGIPTPNAIDAAFKKAKETPILENWNIAARMANSYANVVDVLTDHYLGLYNTSKSRYGDGNMKYLQTAADYEKTRNKNLAMRNDAYLELAFNERPELGGVSR
jgi:hypothetical protein